MAPSIPNQTPSRQPTMPGAPKRIPRSPPRTLPAAPTSATPFPFLCLPAELRNNVYSHIVAVNQTPDICWDTSHIGLLKTCRQIRAELRPLYWSSAHLTVDFPHLERFIAAFFGSTPVPRVTVMFNCFNFAKFSTSWDMTPFLAARARCPDVSWDFRPSAESGWRHRVLADGRTRVDTHLEALYKRIAKTCPDTLLADVAAGPIKQVVLRRVRDWHELLNLEMHIGVSVQDGVLDVEAQKRLEGPCNFLTRFKSPGYRFGQVRALNKVLDRTGRVSKDWTLGKGTKLVKVGVPRVASRKRVKPA